MRKRAECSIFLMYMLNGIIGMILVCSLSVVVFSACDIIRIKVKIDL